MTLCPRCRLHPPAPSRGYCPSCLVDMGLVRGLPETCDFGWGWTEHRVGEEHRVGPGRGVTVTILVPTPMIAFSDRQHRREQTAPWVGYHGFGFGRYCQCGELQPYPCQSCREAERWRPEPVVVFDETHCALCGFGIKPGGVYCATCFAEEMAT